MWLLTHGAVLKRPPLHTGFQYFLKLAVFQFQMKSQALRVDSKADEDFQQASIIHNETTLKLHSKEPAYMYCTLHDLCFVILITGRFKIQSIPSSWTAEPLQEM